MGMITGIVKPERFTAARLAALYEQERARQERELGLINNLDAAQAVLDRLVEEGTLAES